MERRFRELARRRGGWALKWTSPGRVGVPDRLLFMPGGRLYLVELKAPGRHARPSQLVVHERLAALGFPVHVVDDADAFFRMVDAEGQRLRQ